MTKPATINGQVLPKVDLNSLQNWQNPAGKGPYQTLSKSIPVANEEYMAN